MEENILSKKEKRGLAREKKEEERTKKQAYKNLKRFFMWVATACLLVFVGVRGYGWITAPEPQVNGHSIELTETDWVKGNVEASVTLLEYGDFECPACVNYYFLL